MVLNAIVIIKIKTDLAKKLFLKVLRSLPPFILLVFFPDSNYLRTRSTTEAKFSMFILEQFLLLKLFCFQATAAPALASTFTTIIYSPSSIWWALWLFITFFRTSFQRMNLLRLILSQRFHLRCTLVTKIWRLWIKHYIFIWY